MTIIDLLIKIANGEEVPKKIHIRQFQCDFIFNGHTYLSEEKEPQNIYWCLHSSALNYEVEIIEEDKEIEELDLVYKDIKYAPDSVFKEEILSYCDNLQYKINELIKAVNELKKGK